MATDVARKTSLLQTNNFNRVGLGDITSQQRQEHFAFLQQKPCSCKLEIAKDGTVRAHVSSLSPVCDTDAQITVTSSAKDCNLNVYASAKCSKDDVFMNRAKPVALSSSGNSFRVGSRIFYNFETSSANATEHFDVPEVSFYIDHIEQHGKYLFVTSRQKLLEVPDDGSADSAKKDKKKDKSLKALLGKRKNQDIDSSESDSEATGSESSVESEALSAYESWSEASTEHSETEILRDTRPQYAAVPGDNRNEGTKSTPDDEDGSSSSASSESSEGSDDDDSDDESVEASNTRYAYVMDDEEEDEMWDRMQDDPDEPFFDGDEWKGAWGDSGDESDGGGRAEVDGDGDTDTDSDSDKDDADKQGDKNKDDAVTKTDEQTRDVQDPKMTTSASNDTETELNDNEGTVTAAKDKVSKAEEKTKPGQTKNDKDEEEPPGMLGNAVAQLQVFDLTTSPITRVFRFTRPTVQLVRDSPPVVHPTKSLVVWPLGDNNILFADYKENTYFIRKFRASRFWSQHVKIECRFSKEGQYLHVAGLEMRRNLPVKKKNSRSVEKGKQDKLAENKQEEEKDKAEADEEKAKSKCDLLVLTYKLSRRKTTRAPPVLVHRTQLPLGEIRLTKALPTFIWASGEVFAAHAVDGDLKVFRISCLKTASVSGLNVPFGVQVPRVPIRVEAIDHSAEVYFLPPAAPKHHGRLIITKEQSRIDKSIFASNGNTESDTEAVKVDEENGEGADVSSSKEGSKSLDIAGLEVGDNNAKSDKPPEQHNTDGHCMQVIDIDIGLDKDSWKEVDASELDKMVDEGMGQMEVEMVKFDRTDDCDCCDD